jgi:glucosamine kinase
MILIGDSGSTKTQWVFMNAGKALAEVQTIGLNPYFITSGEMENIFLNEVKTAVNNNIEELFFYGSGISATEKIRQCTTSLQRCFPSAKIEVQHDMLGAARALLQREPGMACILGTGSNVCSYNGQDITATVFTTGYVLGDEGAGSNIGKKILKSFFSGKMPPALTVAFREKYSLTPYEILDRIYKEPFPNRFIASFCEFASENIKYEFIEEMVRDSFYDFIEEMYLQIEGWKGLPAGFCGSVAFGFADILREATDAYGIEVKTILKTPMQGLMEYHSRKV